MIATSFNWKRAVFYALTAGALSISVAFYLGLEVVPQPKEPVKIPPTWPENSGGRPPAGPPQSPTLSAKPLSMAGRSLPTESPSDALRAPASAPSGHLQYTYNALLTPSGPLYSNQPFLSRLGAATAWQSFANTNAAPVIAVIDTGFALNHNDLKNRWQTKPAENNLNGLDNDTNGYINDWRGWNFVDNSNNPLAGKTNANGNAVGHGTLTAGLAGLLNPGATIMPLQVLDDNGVGYTDQVASAVRYAADNGATIISMSLGSTGNDLYLKQQIDYAIAKGVLVVAAAGNDGCNCLLYPAAYPGVLAVGASDANNNRASFSSYGPNLTVLAPGTAGDVCSTYFTASNPTSSYSCGFSGTSLAAPIVSGLAALLLQQHPMTNANDVTALLIHSAQKLSAMGTASRTDQYGYGLIQAGTSVSLATIQPPFGQFSNKSTLSLSSTNPQTGPDMSSTCSGIPGASCEIRLLGPSGQTNIVDQKTLDDYGGAEFIWNAASLGLTPGQWTVLATTVDFGQTKTSALTLTVMP